MTKFNLDHITLGENAEMLVSAYASPDSLKIHIIKTYTSKLNAYIKI